MRSTIWQGNFGFGDVAEALSALGGCSVHPPSWSMNQAAPCPNTAEGAPRCKQVVPLVVGWGGGAGRKISLEVAEGALLTSRQRRAAHQHSFRLQGDKLHASRSKGTRLTHTDEFQQSPVDGMRMGMGPTSSLCIGSLQ